MRTTHLVPLSRQALDLLKAIHYYSGQHDLIFIGDHNSNRPMSHQERNSVRAAYIHRAEHLEERKQMMQWWADYIDANRNHYVSPFSFNK